MLPDPLLSPEDDALVDAYVRHAERSARREEWTDEDFGITWRIRDRDPESEWRLLCHAIDRASPDAVATIGTGELESFIHFRGAEFGERIAERAESNERFHDALANAWIERGLYDPALEERIQRAVPDTPMFIDSSGEEDLDHP